MALKVTFERSWIYFKYAQISLQNWTLTNEKKFVKMKKKNWPCVCQCTGKKWQIMYWIGLPVGFYIQIDCSNWNFHCSRNKLNSILMCHCHIYPKNKQLALGNLAKLVFWYFLSFKYWSFVKLVLFSFSCSWERKSERILRLFFTQTPISSDGIISSHSR